MMTNFNELWNNPKFITDVQKEKIDKEVALIGRFIRAKKVNMLIPFHAFKIKNKGEKIDC